MPFPYILCHFREEMCREAKMHSYCIKQQFRERPMSKDARGVVKVVRLRGQDVFSLPPGQKILMEWSRGDQPVGEAAGLLGGYIGSVGTSFNKFPIDKLRWPDVSSKIKDEVYKDSIQTKIDGNDGIHKHHILGKIGKSSSNISVWEMLNVPKFTFTRVSRQFALHSRGSQISDMDAPTRG
ncbi:hypothetical protein P8452_70914 [Trifolium repens]|nr:hypothetical protein P8452_70914 [Trifolium repens]